MIMRQIQRIIMPADRVALSDLTNSPNKRVQTEQPDDGADMCETHFMIYHGCTRTIFII
jgi:hypothetical protein